MRWSIVGLLLGTGCNFDYFLSRLDGTIAGEAPELQSGFFYYETSSEGDESIVMFVADRDEACPKQTELIELQREFFDLDSSDPSYPDEVDEYVAQYNDLVPDDVWSFSVYLNSEGSADDLGGTDLPGIDEGEFSNVPGKFSGFFDHATSELSAEITEGDGFTSVDFHRDAAYFESRLGNASVVKHKRDEKLKAVVETTAYDAEDADAGDFTWEIRLEYCPEFQVAYEAWFE